MSVRSGTIIIAEAGVNHNGSEDLALELIDVAAASGADAVKFQTFNASSLASASAPKADYQTRSTAEQESQLQMLERLQLSPDAHKSLMARCKAKGISFLSSPFDLESLDLLTTRLGLRELKLGSGELTNGPLLLAAARSGCDVILSTGMATLEEVRTALGVMAFGYSSAPDSQAGHDAFSAALSDPECWQQLRSKVALLHCTTDYPSAPSDANLKAIDTLREDFGLRTGFSDHTVGHVVTLAAVARGAEIIEKHFTLDRSLPGPDHAASLEPSELAQMVRDIRTVEASLGNGIKQPCTAELANLPIARKSLFAAKPIKSGEVFTKDHLTTKRPANGRSPMDYWSTVGSTATRDYDTDEPIDG